MKSDKASSVEKYSNSDHFEIKLRAYERLTLFLDRIRPIGMINRLDLVNCDINTLKTVLVKNIISEYEYNVSQQIYISDELWILIDKVKDATIKSIHEVSDCLNDDNSSEDFVRSFRSKEYEINLLIKNVQKILKKEVRYFS